MKHFKQVLYFPYDVIAIFKCDPALKWKIFWIFEILLYPSVYVMFFHRISHFLYFLKIPFIPRLISQILRFFTWIEIHPWAYIDKWFFIDHWMWVVIGETTEIWKNVLIYHQVTLGWSSLESWKRHPTIWDNVLIWAWAKVFWNITIWNNSQIGWASVITKDIPDNSVCVWNPWRIIKLNWKKHIPVQELDQIHLPDPIWDRLNKIENELKKINKA
jgi:serine O-acetyltransferase